jgi:hypothetical protein
LLASRSTRHRAAEDGRSLVALAFSPSTTYGSAFLRRSKNPKAPRASADPRLLFKEHCMAGIHAKHQQSEIAKKKQQDAVFFVKHPPRASADPRLPSRRTAWQEAMRSTSNRRLPRKNSRMLCFS